MNHKLFGNKLSTAFLLFAVIVVGVGCSESIPGHPEKTVEEYIKAVQSNDFEKIYHLNFLTARQKVYIGGGDEGEVESLQKEHFEKAKKGYEEYRQQDQRGLQWAEKYYFTPNATIKVEEARYPSGAGDDSVNAEYEKDQNVYVTVKALYNDKNEAPTLGGKRAIEAEYDCILKKIRQPGNVRVYSHDENWYIGACIMDHKKTKVESGN